MKVVRVVPDVPSFSVDDGFAYRLPEGLDAGVGSLVRVPLGGRRVRGWVVSAVEPERPSLKEVISVSGDLPVFDHRLLEVLRWAALRYVAPLAALLAKSTPPNLPRRAQGNVSAAGRVGGGAGVRTIVGPGPWGPVVVPVVAPAIEAGSTAVVIASTVDEAEAIFSHARDGMGESAVFASSHLPAKEVTAAWVAAAIRPGTLLVGTREVALWPWADPGVVVLVGEGRRGMKDKATPTVHVRDVVLRRRPLERFDVVMCDAVPSAEAVTASDEVTSTGKRAWGLIEVVDRRGDPPGSGLLAATTRAAIRAVLDDRRSVLLFSDRRIAAQRCIRCRALRRCATCGAGPGASEACPRCGAPVGACTRCGGKRFEALGSAAPRVMAEAARIVGREVVGDVGSGRPIVVGTERDLPGLTVDLTVVVDADGPLLAPNYRAGEDALRMLGRAVAAAGTGRGRRAIVQTVDPEHPVIQALASGDPLEFVRGDAARRSRAGFPPGGEIVVVEVTGLAGELAGELAAEVGSRAEVHGPAPQGDGLRWLLQGRDLSAARTVLRGVVGRWREGGARVRVDADPIEL
ncbi:MAG TPA: hypothetical protein VK960_09520 [Acidimicrobiia bacterium]|nr:hypothetical protein [Acidimicrobiia bacterium]